MRTVLFVALAFSLTSAGEALAQYPTAKETYDYRMSECKRVYDFKVENARGNAFYSKEQLVARAQAGREACEKRAKEQYEALLKMEQGRAKRQSGG